MRNIIRLPSHKDQRATGAAAPGSQRGKSSPPALELTVTPSPHVIRATVRNRVDNQLLRSAMANQRRRRAERLRARFSEWDHAAHRSLASRFARWSEVRTPLSSARVRRWHSLTS